MARIIDAHVYLGTSIQGFAQEAAAVLGRMDELGIEAAVAVPVRPPDYAYPSQNDHVAAACAASGGRLVGLGRVDARLPNAASEAERCLRKLGMRGIFVHPWEDVISIADHRFDAIAEVCRGGRVPLMVAAGYPHVSEATQVAALASRFPEVPVVMCNGGQINISGLGQRSAWLAMEQHANLHITTSGVYREDYIEEVARDLGAWRVLFGSQAPVYDHDLELHRVLWAHTDEDTRAAMLWENASRLFLGVDGRASG